jgi:hypothetical protein
MKHTLIKIHNAPICFNSQDTVLAYSTRSSSRRSPTLHFAKIYSSKSRHTHNRSKQLEEIKKVPLLPPEPCLYFQPWVTCSYLKSFNRSQSMCNLPYIPNINDCSKNIEPKYQQPNFYQNVKMRYTGFFPSSPNKSTSKSTSTRMLKAPLNLIVCSTHRAGKRLEIVENRSMIQSSNIRSNRIAPNVL